MIYRYGVLKFEYNLPTTQYSFENLLDFAFYKIPLYTSHWVPRRGPWVYLGLSGLQLFYNIQ